MRYYFTRYLLDYPKVLLYMLQDTEYKLRPYLAWVHRTSDFRTVIKRRTLVRTAKVRLLLFALRLVALIMFAAVFDFVLFGILTHDLVWIFAAVILAAIAPFVLSHGLLIPLFIGWLFIQKPKERMIIHRAETVFANHPGIRIAVAGSYGKTTAKEILKAVIGTGLKVAATPGSMNTVLGISRFAVTLKGDEDVLIVELGEEKDGDVRRLSELVRPDIGIVTGINEAHLGSFKSLDHTAATILELGNFVKANDLYLNEESEFVRKYKKTGGQRFNLKGVAGWKVKDATTSIEGTRFTMVNDKETVRVKTALVGLQTVGMTAMSVAVATRLGLSAKIIEKGLHAVKPFEHRMEPRFMHGAWIIDDTYNGNSDGVEAGLTLLKSLKAKRRIYVTPGLVEQGEKTQSVHEHIGELAASSADIIVLMDNSVTNYIRTGLDRKKFKGELIIEDNPLEFYTNLDQFIAAGDVVLMQNDWTDNYR